MLLKGELIKLHVYEPCLTSPILFKVAAYPKESWALPLETLVRETIAPREAVYTSGL